jgi:hypothetical protein
VHPRLIRRTNEVRLSDRPQRRTTPKARIPASERTREKLKALRDGRSEVEDGRSALVRLAARLIIEEALKGERAMRSDAITTPAAPPPAAGIATAIEGVARARRRAQSNIARRRSPIGTCSFARAFVKWCGAAPRSWRPWRWRCMRAGCRGATSKRCLPTLRAAACRAARQ